MAWTAPRTWVTGETVTAALMNAHVRDNLLETSAATVTTAGDLSYADAANSMGSRLGIGAVPSILSTTGSAPAWRGVAQSIGDASYTFQDPLAVADTFYQLDHIAWASGTNVTVSVETGTRALVWFGARSVAHSSAGGNVQLSYAVGGASSISSANTYGTVHESGAANDLGDAGRVHLATLTAGTNNFVLTALVSVDAAATILRPYIVVMGL